MSTIAETYATAIRYHQSGNIHAAEHFYRQILEADPTHADSHGMLGVCFYQTGKHADAEASIKRAIAIRPHVPGFHCNLALVYQALGNNHEAINCYLRALQYDRWNAEAHCVLGGLYRFVGQFQDAETHCRMALQIQPHFPQAYNNLGLVFAEQQQWQLAEAEYRTSIRQNPNYAEVHASLGRTLTALKRSEEAMHHYREAIRLSPGYPEGNNGLGILYKHQGKWDDAAKCFLEALRFNPNYSAAWSNLGDVRKAQQQYDEAMSCYDRGRQLDPKAAEPHYNRSLLLLSLGRWLEGWPDYEWRFHSSALGPLPFAQPRWDGSPLGRRIILLVTEQGLGDTLQFIRYVPLVKELGGRVLVQCLPVLRKLLAHHLEEAEIVIRGEPLPKFDVYAPLMSLPGILKTTVETVPADIPYLHADDSLVEKWRAKLAELIPAQESKRVLKIGIAWQGNPEAPIDRGRSIALAEFAPLAKIPGVHLISLQKGPGTEQLQKLNGLFEVLDLGDSVDGTAGAFMDTAAIMANLDLVISSDSAVAHLAGALGVPMWVALQLVPDWRWLLDRDDSPWYPTMRLFRQSKWNQWGDVFQRMVGELKEKTEKN